MRILIDLYDWTGIAFFGMFSITVLYFIKKVF